MRRSGAGSWSPEEEHAMAAQPLNVLKRKLDEIGRLREVGE
jgi:hypothetical protein